MEKIVEVKPSEDFSSCKCTACEPLKLKNEMKGLTRLFETK